MVKLAAALAYLVFLASISYTTYFTILVLLSNYLEIIPVGALIFIATSNLYRQDSSPPNSDVHSHHACVLVKEIVVAENWNEISVPSTSVILIVLIMWSKSPTKMTYG